MDNATSQGRLSLPAPDFASYTAKPKSMVWPGCESVEIDAVTMQCAQGFEWTWRPQGYLSEKGLANVDPLARRQEGHDVHVLEIQIPKSWRHLFIFAVARDGSHVVVQHDRNGTFKASTVVTLDHARRLWKALALSKSLQQD